MKTRHKPYFVIEKFAFDTMTSTINSDSSVSMQYRFQQNVTKFHRRIQHGIIFDLCIFCDHLSSNFTIHSCRVQMRRIYVFSCTNIECYMIRCDFVKVEIATDAGERSAVHRSARQKRNYPSCSSTHIPTTSVLGRDPSSCMIDPRAYRTPEFD